jgi:hypothetical protein
MRAASTFGRAALALPCLIASCAASCAARPAGTGTDRVTSAPWPMPNGKDDVSNGAPNPMSYTDNLDGTVSDLVTHLMWQQRVPSTGGASDDGNLTWAEADATCGSLVLASHTDWRLPTQIELVSLVDYSNFGEGQGHAHAPVDESVFPDTPADAFWSSTRHAGSAAEAWTVYMDVGFTYAYDVTTVGKVRCVRSTTPPAATVVDTATELTWQRALAAAGGDDGAGRSTWAHAKTACASLGSGYRVPTVKELLTIVDFSRSSPAIDTSATAFPDTPPDAFWTATPLAGLPPTSAWFVNFADGYAGNGEMTQPSRVRCVR